MRRLAAGSFALGRRTLVECQAAGKSGYSGASTLWPNSDMNSTGRTILERLEAVAEERRQRAADPRLAAAVNRLKAFQHARFNACYADLLASPRYAAAARFFLDDLYGPWDFAARDAQFARIVPALVRLFPTDIVDTVAALARLHALSERLDGDMARLLADEQIDDRSYASAWQRVGNREDRMLQIALVAQVGEALERYTRRPALRHSLRLMRVPARAAGLETLHRFLERGFDTFRGMGGASAFLATIVSREERLALRLFAEDGRAAAAAQGLVALATSETGASPVEPHWRDGGG